MNPEYMGYHELQTHIYRFIMKLNKFNQGYNKLL